MDDQEFQQNIGVSRRTLLKRGAVVGGTLVWAAPAVQTLAKPAFAAGGSAVCDSSTCVNIKQHGVIVGHLECAPPPQDRDCPCECAGLGGSKCAEVNPCNSKIVCGSLQSGPCPTS